MSSVGAPAPAPHAVPPDEPDPVARRTLGALAGAYETAAALAGTAGGGGGPAGGGSGAGGAAASVVPDLMEVYENMRKSSTPQDAAGAAAAERGDTGGSASHGGQHFMAQQQQPEFLVPPIPPEALAALSHPPSELTNSGATASDPSTGPAFRRGGGPRPSAATARRSSHGVAAPTPDESGSETDTDHGSARGAASRKRKSLPSSDKENSGGKDGRWSKRFTWPDDLHRDFCSAIFDVGLKQASPTQVIEFMPKHADINSERVKSHLQKYRIHRAKSKQEFMSSYDTTLKHMKQNGVDPSLRSLAGGQVAAYLTYSEIAEPTVGRSDRSKNAKPSGGEPPQKGGDKGSAPAPQAPQQGYLVIPKLSEAEKNSPIGTSLGYLMGLFFSLKQQLMAQRAAQAGAVTLTPTVHQPSAPSQAAPMMSVLETFARPGTVSAPSSFEAAARGLGRKPSLMMPDLTTATQRSSIEESTLMKREMDNQMAVQTKMRALKEQELNKYRTHSPETTGAILGTGSGANDHRDATRQPLSPPSPSFSHQHHHHHQQQPLLSPMETHADYGAGDHHVGADFSHGAGDYGGEPDQRSRGISIALNDDFWNTDMVDDQLFEFLMNN